MTTPMQLRPQNPIALWSNRLVWAVLYIYCASYMAAIICLASLLIAAMLTWWVSPTLMMLLSVLCWSPIMLYIGISPFMLVLSGVMTYAPTAKIAAFPISVVLVALVLFAVTSKLYVFASPWVEVICGLFFASYVGAAGYIVFKTSRHAMRDIATKITARGAVQLGCGAARHALPPPELAP